MYSLNVPLPAAVRREIDTLRPALTGFDAVRETPTLVLKRFGSGSPDGFASIESEVRLTLANVAPFTVRLAGVGVFQAPVSGPAPVAYLAIESAELERLHARLVDEFGAIDGVEGADYVPHVTLARGGNASAVDRIADREVEPVEWTVSELWFWDGRAAERAGRVSLAT